MKIVAGVYQPDTGEIRLKGKPIKLTTPLVALDAGIAMIHQELNLMPYMTVAENIWIRREPMKGLGFMDFVDHKEMRHMTEHLFRRLKIDLDPEAEVRSLSVANRQIVEIAKAVSFESDILIMDEPTSALTEREVDHLFAIIADLKAHGVGIVYITHKMDEVFTIADDVSVFRDGVAEKGPGFLGSASHQTLDDLVVLEHVHAAFDGHCDLSRIEDRGPPTSTVIAGMPASMNAVSSVPLWPGSFLICSIGNNSALRGQGFGQPRGQITQRLRSSPIRSGREQSVHPPVLARVDSEVPYLPDLRLAEVGEDEHREIAAGRRRVVIKRDVDVVFEKVIPEHASMARRRVVARFVARPDAIKINQRAAALCKRPLALCILLGRSGEVVDGDHRA
jgi:ABC-type branched-subunit amino acid transport system ATPase component